MKSTLKGRISAFQLSVLFLSIFVVLSLIIEMIFRVPNEIMEILKYIDFIICIVFFIDFIQQFRAASSKLEYMKWGWLDLISCIPLMELNQYARLIRILRLIKAIKTISMISHIINENKSSSSFHLMMFISLMMMTFCSIYVLYLERQVPGANIITASDAFWWTFVTITTVGYGDLYPITLEGRIVAMILITTGVGLFGSFTAMIASWVFNSNTDWTKNNLQSEIELLNHENERLRKIIKDNNSFYSE
ncbi:potassium channel family protein [Vibrio alginolyticus]|nr:potassium channel family protein [Vibrio parahaemolyticus]ELA7389012.1 potassium channel family protein [Vibrio alginolyticus]WMN90536.1 potassium channel family protein [Vibrio parahaemolyticus]WMO08193.1 potassium channel family protein [Vibrio parahaemolyticus]